MNDYLKFLEQKIVIAESFGFESNQSIKPSILMKHQSVIVDWAIEGGRRAIFASFGLGKTVMQLEIGHQIIKNTGKPFLIVLPLGVVGEFKRDNDFLNEYRDSIIELEYIKDTIKEELKPQFYVTNYERIRKGDIEANKFGGVSFDEASILRNLNTQTTDYVLRHFKNIPYRFVATATPTPNDFIEILNYADYLGVIDRGHALTRFFQRDSTKAGNLKLYENKKEEFWKWVSTWAVFINKPSDLGYNDKGYDLPKLNLYETEVYRVENKPITNKYGDLVLFRDNTKSLLDVSREKRDSLELRINKTIELIKEKPNENWIIWHHLESERHEIEKRLKKLDVTFRSVYGSQKNDIKEKNLIDFSNGEYQILVTKPQIAGSGCNFQHTCFNMVFAGINYKFNDFIQAVHRIYRFKQTNKVNIYIIFTQNERQVLKKLNQKWANHIELQSEMIDLVRNYGLNSDKIKSDMKRQMFSGRRESKCMDATLVNNDSTLEFENLESNSMDMILTSIPFGDHYEYSDNYNDFGQNDGNDNFFTQMDYLTPNLLRVLKPGRIAAIHVKDRIRYSYQNGHCGFTTIDDFSGETVRHFKNHGFYLIGKITVTTDVVRENNQTYRLTHKEQCKDATKMGVGLPEYILLFRKQPTNYDKNAYADTPVTKTREDYDLARWQLDAHAFWKSDGNRFMSSDEMDIRSVKAIYNAWKRHDKSENVYSFAEHLKASKDLASKDKLSKLFMTLPTHSTNDMVWTDINRMNTLNTAQANKKKEKHICPLQLDIIERLITRYSNEGDVICDPFGGLFSTPYKAQKLGRKSFACELNPQYYDDGLYHMKSLEYKLSVPTLFDMLENVG